MPYFEIACPLFILVKISSKCSMEREGVALAYVGEYREVIDHDDDVCIRIEWYV